MKKATTIFLCLAFLLSAPTASGATEPDAASPLSDAEMQQLLGTLIVLSSLTFYCCITTFFLLTFHHPAAMFIPLYLGALLFLTHDVWFASVLNWMPAKETLVWLFPLISLALALSLYRASVWVFIRKETEF